MPSRSWMELLIGCLECKDETGNNISEYKTAPIMLDRKMTNIQWSNNLESPTNIPSVNDMTDHEKRTLWYNTEELMRFARNEISRRESIGIFSKKIMCKSAEEMDDELHDTDIVKSINIEV